MTIVTHRYKAFPVDELAHEVHDIVAELHIRYNGAVGAPKPKTLAYTATEYKTLSGTQKESIKKAYWESLGSEARQILADRQLDAKKQDLEAILAIPATGNNIPVTPDPVEKPKTVLKAQPMPTPEEYAIRLQQLKAEQASSTIASNPFYAQSSAGMKTYDDFVCNAIAPKFVGSTKQRNWAAQIAQVAIHHGLHRHITADQFNKFCLSPIGRDANWWIDRRDDGYGLLAQLMINTK